MMIIVVSGYFDIIGNDGIPTGKKEFVASHGYDCSTGKQVVLENVHPKKLGAFFDSKLGEWVLP